MFSDQLTACKCCPRNCGINRLAGEISFCRIGSEVLVAHTGLHYGEEPPISGTNGSGTIFFAGCNLHCVYCQNYQISQEFHKSHTRKLTAHELATEMIRLQEAGAHNINFVSPSHVIFQVADAIILAKKKGLKIPVVYNSGGYDSIEALQQIHGLTDIYMPDIKYMDNRLGRRLSAVSNYADIVPKVLSEMFNQTGLLEVDSNGIAVKGLLVRHLVLPGHLENSRKCLQVIADISTNIQVSLMSQYSPQHKAFIYPDINRKLRPEEYNEILDYALSLGLHNLFIQEMSSQDQYLPDFDRDRPFDTDKTYQT